MAPTAQAAEGQIELPAQVGHVLAAAVLEFAALQEIPHSLGRVQLGGVAGQPLQVQPLGRPTGQKLLDAPAAVIGAPSQITSSLPRTCRRSWRRKATISGPQKALDASSPGIWSSNTCRAAMVCKFG